MNFEQEINALKTRVDAQAASIQVLLAELNNAKQALRLVTGTSPDQEETAYTHLVQDAAL